MVRFFSIVLVLALGVPAPFVSGMFHICEFSGHVHENCACGEAETDPQWVKEPCCSIHVTLDAVAISGSTSLELDQVPVEVERQTRQWKLDKPQTLLGDGSRIRPPPTSGPPPWGSTLRTRICSWQA